MSQGQVGNMDIAGMKWTVILKHVHTHRQEHKHTARARPRQTDRETNMYTDRKGEQSVITSVPPPPSQTCGPEVEKTA